MNTTKIIPPFQPQSEEVRANVARIMEAAPVQNLTEDEVLQTLRLLQLHSLLLDEARTQHHSVTVYQDDVRLQTASADDRFLALLLDADVRGTILTSKRCRYCFGQTQYYWRKVAGRCVIITTASGMENAVYGGLMKNADYGGRYFGRGWKLAPNIVTLRRWIVSNSQNPDINKLKV